MGIVGRQMTDFTSARKNLYEGTKQAASEIPPYETPTHIVQLVDVDYDPNDDEDKNPERFDFKAQKAAVYEKDTLGRRLRGTWQMVNKSTGEIEQQQRRLLAVVPRVNEDATVIYRGSRYSVQNQQRVKPAAFARLKKNEELESFINVKPGTGSSHRYILQPETGVFSLNIGHSRVPLVPLLKSLGATDEQLDEAWGPQLAKVNREKIDKRAIHKLYERLVPNKYKIKNPDEQTMQFGIAEAIKKMRVDPWSMKRNTGLETENIDAASILAATKKVLAMNRGESGGDDRDHMAFQTYHTIEDIFPERIRLDKNRIQKQFIAKAVRKGGVAAIPPKALQPQIEAAIFSSGLAVQPELANPLDSFDRATRLTKMGEGGMSSTDSVPMESRDVHPSQYGFVDPARTVESLKTGIDTNLASQTIRGEDGRLYTPVINARTGQRELKTPEDLLDANLAMSSRFSGQPGLMEVTRKGGEGEDHAYPEEVDYILPDFEQSAFSPLSNLIALKSAGAMNRLAMGARFIAQSLPLKNREAPLVQQAVPGSDRMISTNMSMADRVGAVFSNHEGVVTDVTPDGIKVKTAEGVKHVPIHNWTPLGSKTGLHNTPVVQVGSRVAPGQLLAKSNFTDNNGAVAMGLNARVALMPWGDNYEDAITVSRSFAKRMTSEHLYRHRLSPLPEQRVKRNEFISVLPSAYNKDQIGRLDDTGVIKVGETVRKGDPLVLAATPKVSSNLRKRQTKSFSDDSITWDHDDDGVVQEVHRARNGDVVVAVGSTSALKGSDKISDQYGAKGIVRILPDEQMPHDEDGNPYDAVGSDLGVISRQNSNRPHEILLGKIAAMRGKPYILSDFEGENLDDFVEGELKKYGVKDRDTVIDPRNGRRIPEIITGVAHLLKLHHLSESKAHARGVGAYTCHDEQTEVLTLHGWIPWAQATMQTQFATVLPDWSIRYELPTAVTAQYYEGELCGFAGRYLDYLVTPNHRMFVKRPNRKGRSERPFEFKPASEVPGTPGSHGWQVVQGGLKWAATVTGDVTIPVPAYLSLKRKTYHPLIVNELDYAEFLGWFISEGSTTYNKKSRSYEVAISQVQAVNPENFARIEQLLRRLGMSYTYVKDKKRVGKEIRGFRIRDKQWYYHLREFGVGCENKRIPCRIFQGSNTVQRVFLDALMAGDGCYTAQPDGSVCGRYTTTSKELADGLQELLLKLGLGGSVSEVQGRTDRHQTVYEVGLFLTRTIATLGMQKRSTAKFYQQPYAGMVYCATVPSGLLITRRNGKVLLSGNSDGTPAKGSDDDAQAKRLSNQELGALVAHGANSFIRESALLRGQNDPEFHARYMTGADLPAMKVPFVYNKMLAYMKAAGINPVKQGSKTSLMLMNDKDVTDLAGGRELRSGETVDLNKDMKPIKGGLFDESIFGDGSQWGRYQLSEPIPHPLMEDVFRKLMGVTKDQYRDIYAGKQEYKEFGTGPKAIRNWLSNLDVDREVQFARKGVDDSRKTKREEAVVRLRYLRGLADRKIDPKSLMLTQVPILPPNMRPVSRLAGKDTPLIDGMNLLYRDLIEADKNLGSVKGFSSDVSSERLALYDAVQAAVGLREPMDPELRSKQVTGLVKRMVGKGGPKTSFVQRKLLSGTVDMVGRAVIGPSHKIGMDEIGVPEEQAWKLYQMPVIRSLRREGMPIVKAKQLVDSRDPVAKRKLEEVMSSLPVVASRAPVLHKFGIMAFRPKLVEGHSLLMSPLVYTPFGADNDGDAMNFHAVMGEDAARDALEKMLPSKNLFSPRDFKSVNYAPGQDHALGLYLASHLEPDKNARPQTFRSLSDAYKAFKRGEININTPITVLS